MSATQGSYQAVTDGDRETARLHAQAAAIWDREAAALSSLGMQTGGAMLEVGCGGGAILGALRATFRPARIAGVDLDAQLLARARAIAPVARASGDRLPFADGSFDAVVFRLVLRHVPSAAALMAEARRVLRPGGRAFALDVDDGALILEPEPTGWPALKSALDGSARRRGADPHIGRRLPGLLAAAGFSDVRTVALPVTTADLAPPAFVSVLLAPAARPVDEDLLPAADKTAAWAAVAAWAERPDAFGCYLGLCAGGVR